MLIMWKVRFLDSATNELMDKHRLLETDNLEPATKAAIELLIETNTSKARHEVLTFKHLFLEDDGDNRLDLFQQANQITTFGPEEYFEDEAGNEISTTEMVRRQTGNPNLRLIPDGFKHHDIEYWLSEQTPIPMEEIALSSDEIRALGYFVRDFKELNRSAFMKDCPGFTATGTKESGGLSDVALTTAVSDDEIRSFLMIFRRLYMTKDEPGNFANATSVFCKVLGGHPLGKWITGIATEYQAELLSTDHWPMFDKGPVTFTKKQLIDVFLYTRYAHQPKKSNQKHYEDYLNELHGQKGFLAWLFFCQVRKFGQTFSRAGRPIAAWFERYCNHHQITTNVLASLVDEHPGIGSREKEVERQKRIFREKVEGLALEIWKGQGSPQGGPIQFIDEAERQLNNTLQSS